MLSGKHLIDGQWLGEGAPFQATNPATGGFLPQTFHEADDGVVDAAVRTAEIAFQDYAGRSDGERAAFLRAIAQAVEARGEVITETAHQETGLPAARLNMERGRTVGQLRMFADLIESGAHLGIRMDPALPERQPLPRPEIRLMKRPLGPVGVFGASNFPLAFSVAGGDTASALAAGCPVVVKGHPAHPGTGELVAGAILAAIKATGMPAGVFSLLQGASHQVGQALVQHPLIQAVGFTGSQRAGRALFDLACARPRPIPLFAEMGSINPVFVLPRALVNRGDSIAQQWIASLTLGAGQFCTNPGVLFSLEGTALDDFLEAATKAVGGAAPQTMLTPAISGAYHNAVAAHRQRAGVTLRAGGDAADGCQGLPALFEVAARAWLEDSALHEEVFGPSAFVVRCEDHEQLLESARQLEGQLTTTLQLDQDDHELAGELLPILECKAGRLLCNGYPTGVEVCGAMMHGGPYPASTDARFTSVGTLAIERFLRPVAYQNFPAELLAAPLRDA